MGLGAGRPLGQLVLGRCVVEVTIIDVVVCLLLSVDGRRLRDVVDSVAGLGDVPRSRM